MKINIFKIGGDVVDNEETLDKFLSLYANTSGAKILVHGGGKIATKISAALGIKTQMIEGRRVTDAETIKVVTMVYAGLVNKTIVAKLQAINLNAIGLSGVDANLIQSHKRIHSSIDYGLVGDVDKINTNFLTTLLQGNYNPVISPITHNKKGDLLNTNADTIASTIAVAMSQEHDVKLNYCFELPGVLKEINQENSLIPTINKETYRQLKSTGIISDGMVPKLDNCFDAIQQGVTQVRICHALNINTDIGTILKK